MKVDWDLILKYLNDESTPAERKEIEDLRNSDPGFADEFARMQKVWQIPAQKLPAPDIEAALQNVKAKIAQAEKGQPSTNIYQLNEPDLSPTPAAKPIHTYILRAAAVLVIFLTGIYVISKFYSGPEMKTIFVNNIQQQTITLPDGSIVKLDAGSSFQYPESFADENRSVYLNGEAYFDIASDPSKPFMVNTNNAVVTVLGTEFNIRAWEDSPKATLAVAEGRVSFKSNVETANAEVILTAGQVSSIEGDSSPVEPVEEDISKYLSWQMKEMSFQGAPLTEVLGQLERWYNLQFVLPDDIDSSARLTIHIKNEPVENILDVICIMMDLSYEQEENQIIFIK